MMTNNQNIVYLSIITPSLIAAPVFYARRSSQQLASPTLLKELRKTWTSAMDRELAAPTAPSLDSCRPLAAQ